MHNKLFVAVSILVFICISCKKASIATGYCSMPTRNAQDLVVSAASPTSINLHFLRGNGSGGALVVARLINTQRAAPTAGLVYKHAKTEVNTGQDTTGANNFVVYNDSLQPLDGINIIVGNVNTNNDYAFDVYEYTAGNLCYGPPTTIVFEHSSITYVNNSFTDLELTVNGNVNVLRSKSRVSFYGVVGEKLSYSANTAVYNTNGTLMGVKLTWSGDDVFLAGRTSFNHYFQADTGKFLLYITNKTDSLKLTNVLSSAGTADELSNMVNVNPDSAQHIIGYYKRSANNEIRAYYRTQSNATGFKSITASVYKQDNVGNYYFSYIVK